MPAPNFDVIVSLAKRRGFVFPSSEIYGGMAGFWDYGPLGVELKNNIKAAWWRHMVPLRDDVAGIDAAIIMNPRVWEASGHVAGFSDPMVDCRNCKLRFREDDLKGPPSEIACPNCGQRGHADRGAPVQPHVRHPRRAGGGIRIGRLPAARRRRRPCSSSSTTWRPPRAGSCRSGSRRSGRSLPQRDHAGQLHLPPARVRADGDGVLRPSPRRGRVVRLLGRRAPPLVDRCARHRARAPAPAPARGR